MTGIINTNIMLHPLSCTSCSTCQAVLQVLCDYQSTSGCQKFKLHTLNFNHQHVALQIIFYLSLVKPLELLYQFIQLNMLGNVL